MGLHCAHLAGLCRAHHVQALSSSVSNPWGPSQKLLKISRHTLGTMLCWICSGSLPGPVALISLHWNRPCHVWGGLPEWPARQQCPQCLLGRPLHTASWALQGSAPLIWPGLPLGVNAFQHQAQMAAKLWLLCLQGPPAMPPWLLYRSSLSFLQASHSWHLSNIKPLSIFTSRTATCPSILEQKDGPAALVMLGGIWPCSASQGGC